MLKSRVGKTLFAVILVLVVALIVARLALPHYLLRIVNRKLDQIPEYKGHIDDLDLALWKGAYKVKGVSLRKIEGASSEPFFYLMEGDISVEWHALFRKSLVAEIDLYSPKLNFVVAQTKKQSQTSIDTSWTSRVKEMAPVKINRFRIHDGEVHFRDLTREPKVNVYLSHIDAEAVGLTNKPGKGETLPATFALACKAMEKGDVKINLRLDPLAKQPTFDLDAELKRLPITELNPFLKAYGDVTAESGTVGLYTEMASDEGRFKGYVKPLLENIHIADKTRGNFLEAAWRNLVAGVETVLENREKKQAGTQIPLSGRFSDPHAGIIPSVGYLLRNAFIEALSPSLSHTISFSNVSGGKPTQGAGTVKKENLRKEEKSGK